MMTSKFNKFYWENNYKNKKMGWDIGYVSTPIKTYIDQLINKETSILIPGAGNAYEAEYLFQTGFKNITVLDIAKQPLRSLQKRVPLFPNKRLVQEDFFEHKEKYDLIIEQTFFCALDPVCRSDYVKKISNLLNDGGKIIGLLFDFPLIDEGPPYGGSLNEYKNTFSKHFKIKILDPCYNSIKPRDGRELFIIFEKKIKT